MESFNLQQVLREQNSYVQRQYTAGENGQAAMEARELANAEQAVQAQSGFLGLTLQQKIQDIMIPERVLEEFQSVAVQTLMSAVEPFLNWLEENEVYYTDNLFKTAIQADAKQLYYTKYALQKEAAGDEKAGQNFYASF
jgi:hypothetical protein